MKDEGLKETASFAGFQAKSHTLAHNSALATGDAFQ